MSRPKGSKNKQKNDIQPVITDAVKEIVKEIIVEKIIEVPKKELTDFALYKALRDAGFPQGGVGGFMQDINSNDKVYVPQIGEVYSQFLGDPKDWDKVRDELCRCWIDKNKK